jgi:hypothetical protein
VATIRRYRSVCPGHSGVRFPTRRGPRNGRYGAARLAGGVQPQPETVALTPRPSLPCTNVPACLRHAADASRPVRPVAWSAGETADEVGGSWKSPDSGRRRRRIRQYRPNARAPTVVDMCAPRSSRCATYGEELLRVGGAFRRSSCRRRRSRQSQPGKWEIKEGSSAVIARTSMS